MSWQIEEWTEEDSRLYQELAHVAVPAREDCLAAHLAVLPFGPEDSFRAVELGCGEGFLSSALLDCFRGATVLALDGSASMCEQTSKRLRPYGSRASVAPFDLASAEWRAHLRSADAVLSSLCRHHLLAGEKRKLFASISALLPDGGAFLIADLVEPQRAEARELFAASWDRAAEGTTR